MSCNFQRGKIYMIWSPHIDKVYVGSTTQRLLCMRMTTHKSNYKNFKEGKGNYMTSFDILELGDAKIELIENYPCNSRDELRAREGFHQRSMNCVNKRIECRTNKEWREDNKDKVREYERQLYYKLKEKDPNRVRDKARQFREKNPNYAKEAQKKYREKYPEKQSISDKKYREQPRVKARKREIVLCNCGKETTRGNLWHHKNLSKSHKKWLLTAHNIFNHL